MKDVLFDKLLNYEIRVDYFIENIADVVKGTTNMRLKPEVNLKKI